MARRRDRQQLRQALRDAEDERLPVGEAARALADAKRREHDRDASSTSATDRRSSGATRRELRRGGRRRGCLSRGDGQLVEERGDAALDLVPDPPRLSASSPAGSSSSQSTYRLPGMYGHASPQPIVTTTSAHSASCALEPARHAARELGHERDDLRVDVRGRRAAGRARLVALPCGSAEERLGHLRASGVLDADEENVRHRLDSA